MVMHQMNIINAELRKHTSHHLYSNSIITTVSINLFLSCFNAKTRNIAILPAIKEKVPAFLFCQGLSMGTSFKHQRVTGLHQRCENPGCLVNLATAFCTMTSNIWGF